LTAVLSLSALAANAFELCGDKVQGEILQGFAPGAAKIAFNGKDVPVSAEGGFLIAFGRDDAAEQTLRLDSETYVFAISPQKWDIQNITGLPPKKVTPSKADEAAIRRETAEVRGAQSRITPGVFREKGFIRPVEGRISGNFGGQRILNGEKKNPHQGMDIAAPEGTPVKASGDGTVTLAGFDYFYSGNVAVIDHGQGLFTLYAHLKDISVKKGDRVRQGDVIGRVGKTGRATGAHLHWGASLNGVRFNPPSLLNLKNRKNCFSL
jgi:murein DD-endopeptidase MepM/ murein hydrolase activator NlpD